MSTDKITFLLNWQTTPYHLPIYYAQKLNLFEQQGIKVAILEPNDPSDVTEIIGSGKADLGLKAMIHTLAAKARGFPVTSFGSLLNEPFTGLLYLKSSGISSDFNSLRGKRIGYVGEFGKVQVDELTRHYGMTPADYTPVRCGMNVAKAIIKGEIDAGIGLENIQMVELEEWLASQGRPASDVQMLRIDRLAQLGCCCFCSILYIGNDKFIANNLPKVRAFLRAVHIATGKMLNDPQMAYEAFVDIKPGMGTSVARKQFERSFAYFSSDCSNVPRDWNKVTAYAKRLGIVPDDFVANYTNALLDWNKDPDEKDPEGKQLGIERIQEKIRQTGGVFSGNAVRYIEA